MGFTQNNWGQIEIINKVTMLTKRGSDTIHAVIPTKYQKKYQPKYLNMQIFWLK